MTAYNRLVYRLQLGRQGGAEPASCLGFDPLIALSYLGGVIFDRCRHIAGIDLCRIVKERERNCAVGVIVSAEQLVTDRGERMREHRGLRSVLLKRFLTSVAHESPSSYIALAKKNRKKTVVHDDLIWFVIRLLLNIF